MIILTKVWRVPNLKNNLVFLGALDIQGYNDGVITISRGTLVVMKGKRGGIINELVGVYFIME